jgi:hypothetical protein
LEQHAAGKDVVDHHHSLPRASSIVSRSVGPDACFVKGR